MEISIFLAQFWGWFLVVVSLIFLLKGEMLLEKLTKDKRFFLLFSYVCLILGSVTVFLHNIWVADWRVVITILGWLYLSSGITQITSLKSMQELMSIAKNEFMLGFRIQSIIMGFLGAWLIWISF